jgi:lipid II:glycine glycyltransferase (peptidoglycan interpeptide bridge formation enzyme)
MILKNNFTLELNNSYETLFKSFSKRRKRSIIAGGKNDLNIKNTSILELIKIKKEFYTHIDFPEKRIQELADFVLIKDKGFVLGVFKDNVLLGGSLFLKLNNRIIYLFSSYNNEARKLQVSSFLINTIIKKHENSNFILDFEGSNLPNIASFFKSFGAKNESYYQLNLFNLRTFFL